MASGGDFVEQEEEEEEAKHGRQLIDRDPTYLGKRMALDFAQKRPFCYHHCDCRLLFLPAP